MMAGLKWGMQGRVKQAFIPYAICAADFFDQLGMQAQRDWLDLLQGRAHNVHKVDVRSLNLL